MNAIEKQMVEAFKDAYWAMDDDSALSTAAVAAGIQAALLVLAKVEPTKAMRRTQYLGETDDAQAYIRAAAEELTG